MIDVFFKNGTQIHFSKGMSFLSSATAQDSAVFDFLSSLEPNTTIKGASLNGWPLYNKENDIEANYIVRTKTLINGVLIVASNLIPRFRSSVETNSAKEKCNSFYEGLAELLNSDPLFILIDYRIFSNYKKMDKTLQSLKGIQISCPVIIMLPDYFESFSVDPSRSYFYKNNGNKPVFSDYLKASFSLMKSSESIYYTLAFCFLIFFELIVVYFGLSNNAPSFARPLIGFGIACAACTTIFISILGRRKIGTGVSSSLLRCHFLAMFLSFFVAQIVGIVSIVLLKSGTYKTLFICSGLSLLIYILDNVFCVFAKRKRPNAKKA